MSPVRPGREHDTTCARAHGLITALNRLAVTLGIPTLTDLGHENAGDGFRHPVKKLPGCELGLEQQAFNKVIRGIHSVAECTASASHRARPSRCCMPSGVASPARAAMLQQFLRGRSDSSPSTRSRTRRRGSTRANRPAIRLIRPSNASCQRAGSTL